jgi:hypothetical protein
MYKIIYDEHSPELFKELFVLNSTVHSHSTRNANLIHYTRSEKVIGKRKVVCNGAKLWNELDFDTECSLNSFKKRVTQFVLLTVTE